MAHAGYHRYLNGIMLPELSEKIFGEYTPSYALRIKKAFKKYFGIARTSSLSDVRFKLFIEQCKMLSARELGIYIKERESEPDGSEDLDLDEYLKIINE